MRLASKLAAALAVFFCCLSGFGQAAPISGQAVDQNGVPIPFAQVRVCSVTSSGTPCTPTTFIYYDYNLQNVAPNPYTTDQYGNYTVYAPALAAPNLYVVQLSPASGVTWTYVQNGPYCSLSGCTFTGPVTAPYFNATQSPYYEVNGVQLASTNLLDTTNIAYINKANTFTGSPQTAPVINATTGFQNAGAAALNHVLLGNGTEYVDSATIPYSIISGGSGAGPFSNTGVPCPTNNFSSINCTPTQMVTALDGAAILTAPISVQTITYNVNDTNSIIISNPNTGDNAAAEYQATNGTDFAYFGIAGTGTSLPGAVSFISSNAIAPMVFQTGGGGILLNAPSTTLAGAFNFAADVGLANSYVVIPANCVSAVTPGDIVYFQAGNASTGASSLTYCSGGPAPLVKYASTALGVGDILANSFYGAMFDGADWHLLNSSYQYTPPPTESDQYNTVAGCTFATDGANLTCTMVVTLGVAMADTDYDVGYSEFTNPAVGSAIYDNISIVINSTTQFTATEMTSGSSSIFTGFCGNNPCAYGKSFLFHAHHN